MVSRSTSRQATLTTSGSCTQGTAIPQPTYLTSENFRAGSLKLSGRGKRAMKDSLPLNSKETISTIKNVILFSSARVLHGRQIVCVDVHCGTVDTRGIYRLTRWSRKQPPDAPITLCVFALIGIGTLRSVTSGRSRVLSQSRFQPGTQVLRALRPCSQNGSLFTGFKLRHRWCARACPRFC